jgi:steroid delta-isomerase-like uncharacterized protein
MRMASRNLESVQAQQSTFNERDWDAMRGLIAEECVFVDGRGERHEGPDGFVEGYSKPWADAFSDGQVTKPKYYDAGDTVVTEFVGRGTNDGPLGPMPASGRSVELPYLEIYHFNADGKVVGGRAYFDQLDLLTQLGHAEAPAGAVS